MKISVFEGRRCLMMNQIATESLPVLVSFRRHFQNPAPFCNTISFLASLNKRTMENDGQNFKRFKHCAQPDANEMDKKQRIVRTAGGLCLQHR